MKLLCKYLRACVCSRLKCYDADTKQTARKSTGGKVPWEGTSRDTHIQEISVWLHNTMARTKQTARKSTCGKVPWDGTLREAVPHCCVRAIRCYQKSTELLIERYKIRFFSESFVQEK